MEELGEILANLLIFNLTDTRKVIHNHLSMIRGLYSWEKYTDKEKKVGLGLLANNNISESLFGGLMHNIERFRMISLAQFCV